MVNINIKAVGYFDGQNANKKGDIVFKLKFSYDERPAMAQIMALVGQVITLQAEISGNKPKSIGEFSYEKLVIDKNGQGHLSLTTEYDCVNHEVVEELLPDRDTQEPVVVKFTFSSSVELEDEEETEDDWDSVENDDEEDWS